MRLIESTSFGKPGRASYLERLGGAFKRAASENDSMNLTRSPCFRTSALLFAALACGTTHTSKADGWSTFGDHEKLKNQGVVDVGNLQKVFRPRADFSGPDIYQLNNRCFTFDGLGKSPRSDGPALLIVDQRKIVRMATLLPEIGGIKVEVKDISLADCEQKSPQDVQKELRLMLEKNERLRMQLEENRRLQELGEPK